MNRIFITRIRRTFVVLAAALCVPAFSSAALGQGCVAAHTEQPLIAGLDPTNQQQAFHGRDWADLDWAI